MRFILEVLHTCSNEAKPVHEAPGGSNAVFYSFPFMVKCAMGGGTGTIRKGSPLNQIIPVPLFTGN